MGKEAHCTARLNGETATGKALLETDDVIFRSPTLKFKLPLKTIRVAEARAGVLHLETPDAHAELQLGDSAEKWATAIRNPRSLLDKLDVKAGSACYVKGITDDDFLAELNNRAKAVRTANSASLIFLGAEDLKSLSRIESLADKIADGAAIWVVAPKGQKHIREIDVLNAGRAAGLKDIKVARFSDTHTAHKFVRAKG